ncbi:phosphatidylglycerol/phosphatidylinositol transfer protein [Gigaspora margarita]|uniref:Phosphatidylglycerol/phosphatidylinositol transfer protein n=1 Tax=Gigaspora margarita TaxID=4874 RepID=A0A8H3X837_GIGMA|nr:phosphatidylglycerol/phosphatidylinositol transfer protein [Gigaspora margarita]
MIIYLALLSALAPFKLKLLTFFSYSPNPIITNHSIEFEIGGISTVTIENGTHYSSMTFWKDEPMGFTVQDFYKEWIEPNGGRCPVAPGNFSYKGRFFETVVQDENDPKNVTRTKLARNIIAKPNGYIISCIEGNYTKIYQ